MDGFEGVRGCYRAIRRVQVIAAIGDHAAQVGGIQKPAEEEHTRRYARQLVRRLNGHK